MSHLPLIRMPVSPPDCALAVAVPLTSEQFLSDLAHPGLKDYASHLKRENLLNGASDEYYCDLFERSAKVARRVCDEVAKLGVTVRRATRLSDLTELLRKFKVVTLVTHWRFTRLIPEDIGDAYGLCRALALPESRVQAAVARAVSELDPALLEEGSSPDAQPHDLRERLAAALNRVAAASHAVYRESDGTSPPLGPAASDGVLERLTRVEMEQSFPGLVAFGRSVEMSDGMRSVREVVEAIPKGFAGLLDLTTCNSVILGKAIKARHPDCVVAMNRYATPLHVRMPLYKLVIQDLAQRPSPYADALAKFHTS
jgi:hypothetical protein